RPRMYRVVLLNDDYTPMDFVVWVLRCVFHKPHDEATRLMLEVHTRGRGVCGVYTYDVARTKAKQVETLAAKHEHPLRCDVEAVETE
ncbi:MAG: ATP-dependent Clp protease adapter ClpS, partial [Candidatus Dadabacteria bacterium]